MPCCVPHSVSPGKACDHHTKDLCPQDGCQPPTTGPSEPFFFFILRFCFSQLALKLHRVLVNRSLWNLYTPPNPSTSLKFFFFPQTVHLNSTYVLPQPFQREKSSHLQGPTVFLIMLQLTEQHLIKFPQQTSR